MKKHFFALLGFLFLVTAGMNAQSGGIHLTKTDGTKCVIPIEGIEIITKGTTSGVDVELINTRTHYADDFDSLITRSGGNLIELDSLTKRSLVPINRTVAVEKRASGRATVVVVRPGKRYISKANYDDLAPTLTGFTLSNVDNGPDTIPATDTAFYLTINAIAGERYELHYGFTLTIDTVMMVTEGVDCYVSGSLVTKTSTALAVNTTSADYTSPGCITVGQIEGGTLILQPTASGLLKIGLGSLGVNGAAIVARSKWYLRKIE